MLRTSRWSSANTAASSRYATPTKPICCGSRTCCWEKTRRREIGLQRNRGGGRVGLADVAAGRAGGARPGAEQRADGGGVGVFARLARRALRGGVSVAQRKCARILSRCGEFPQHFRGRRVCDHGLEVARNARRANARPGLFRPRNGAVPRSCARRPTRGHRNGSRRRRVRTRRLADQRSRPSLARVRDQRRRAS